MQSISTDASFFKKIFTYGIVGFSIRNGGARGGAARSGGMNMIRNMRTLGNCASNGVNFVER
jgi:hypothetical protein